MTENMRYSPVNLGISSAALLVMKPTRISNARQYQSVVDASDTLPVSRQPRDRSNCPGNKQKPIGVTQIAPSQKLGQGSCHRQPREIVIRQ